VSTLSSTLDSVTVYREGALCRRLAQVPEGNERQVRLGGLPLSLEPGSLRARVRDGQGRVVDVRAQLDVQLAEEIDVPAEQKAFEAAGAQLAQLELQRQRLAMEIAELQQLKPTFPEPKKGEPPRPAPIESMLALGDFSEAALSERLGKLRALDQAVADAKEELHLHQRRVQEASSSKRAERARLSRVAVVTLAEPSASAYQLELEYRVPGARWVPSYSLVLERGMTKGALKMRASIAQNTGEDWNDVQLSLSTAYSNRRADMPELKALKIGRRQESPKRSGWREPPPGLETLFETYDDAMTMLRPPPPAAPPPAPVMAAPMAPPPPPAPKMASRAIAPPGNMPLMQAARAPARSAPSTGSYAAVAEMAAPMPAAAPKGGGVFRSRGGGGAMKKEMAAYDEPAEEEASLDGISEGSFGGGMDEDDAFAEPPETPGAALAASFTDYARLTIAAADAPFSRGKLVSANEWDFAFVGMSVQVDVVMAILTRAQRDASRVSQLDLPSQAQPVTAVGAFDYRYDCAARLDVPSTGKWVLVPVTQCDVGLTPEYVCVPSVEPKVYRTLLIANRSPSALLPGPVDVTAGDEFLMTTTLPAIGPGGDSTRLGLGVEEAIKVARKTQFKETTGGFLGGSTVLPHDLEIEINNRLAAPALIEVRERVPVPEGHEKDLKVEETSSTPPWEKVETPVDGQLVAGARRWRVTVPPGQSLKLTAVFAIRMPADKMLVGGNRRN
jgi:hypothetical protein